MWYSFVKIYFTLKILFMSHWFSLYLKDVFFSLFPTATTTGPVLTIFSKRRWCSVPWIPGSRFSVPPTSGAIGRPLTVTDVRRGTSGTSRDVPIFVQFHKKTQNSYTLVVKKTKFVHFRGKKTQNSYTLVVGDALPSPTAVHPWLLLLIIIQP